MNYYPHHIGDFRSGTFNMTRLQRWIYRDMLDVYYDKEAPFPPELAKVCAMIGARTDEEREIVAELLLVKFTLSDAGYSHERCDTEIAAYRVKAEAAQINGKKGGRPPKNNPAKPSGFPLGSDPVSGINPDLTGSKANQEPRTNNHKPITKEKIKDTSPTAPVDLLAGVDAQVAKDFKELRAKAKAPITATAMSEIVKQAEIAGLTLEAALRVCCSRGWRGFKAEWVAPDRQGVRAAPSRQAGFDQLDYNEGIEDGRIT